VSGSHQILRVALETGNVFRYSGSVEGSKDGPIAGIYWCFLCVPVSDSFLFCNNVKVRSVVIHIRTRTRFWALRQKSGTCRMAKNDHKKDKNDAEKSTVFHDCLTTHDQL